MIVGSMTTSSTPCWTTPSPSPKPSRSASTPFFSWKKIGHTNYEAAYAAHLIHNTIPTISQNAIGKVFGIKNISSYLSRADSSRQSIMKPIENAFRKRGLRIEV